MKRLLLTLLLSILVVPAFSVLKERNLARTLGVLRAELEQNYPLKKEHILRLEAQSRQQHAQLVDYMQRSEQIALMLYSQREDYTFDISYACQQATDLYRLLSDNLLPFSVSQQELQMELQRYAALIQSLEQLPPAIRPKGGKVEQNPEVAEAIDTLLQDAQDAKAISDSIIAMSEAYTLTAQQQRDRDICLRLARDLHTQLEEVIHQLNQDQVYYIAVKEKVKELNTYAMARYKGMQESIFFNGGESYFKLLSNLPDALRLAKLDIIQKYSSLNGLPATYSEWRGPIVTFMMVFILVYVAIAIGLSAALVRWLPRRWLPKDFDGKRGTYFTALGLFIFAASIMVVRSTLDSSFILMALGLMTNIAWLALAIVISLLVRLHESQIRLGLRLYLPFIIMAFVVVAFRVLFVPNSVVNLVFPALLAVFSLWQIHTLRVPKGSMPTSDILYSATSMVALVVATAMAWAGFVLMAVQVMVWWMFQLAAIQTLTGLYFLVSRFEDAFVLGRLRGILPQKERESMTDEMIIQRAKEGRYIHRTWAYDLTKRALLPIIAVFSVLYSVWSAAEIFEMTNVVHELLDYHFIDKKGILQISFFKITLVIALWYVFAYLNYAVRSFYQHITRMRLRLPDYQYNFTLANNVIAILVWGVYIIYLLILLQVPQTGISVVSAGLATGMGFAMKDLLENFFYGISLMTGRVRVGDYIECDGIMGRVESISYQSTQVATADGSIIAFLNSQLFNKNFKNLTRNNAYELNRITIGVAYGVDIEQVRRLIIDAILPLDQPLPDGRPLFKPDTNVGVIVADFGDSSVNLIVSLWVLVELRGATLARAREIIYNTLGAHNIEIPFPQLDVRMRSSEDSPKNYAKDDHLKINA